MAIQQIDLAVPNGDTVRSANVKINQNFSNSAHAASRLVGVSTSNIPSGADISASYSTNWLPKTYDGIDTDAAKLPLGVTYIYTPQMPILASSLPIGRPALATYRMTGDTLLQLCYPSAFSGTTDYHYRVLKDSDTPSEWVKVYTTSNTTKDTATGFLKASSPVLHVYNDSITKIHEANQLDIKVDKKGVGHYEIHGTTGLRKNDGWFMSPPRDVHGNVLCMVDLEEKDGVVILKTYKKLFDFETVSIVHDYDNPMDIPEGVCVEFRFNDLPQEQLDEPIE